MSENQGVVSKKPMIEFKCKICKNFYSSSNALNEHKERVHRTDGSYVLNKVCNF